MSSKLAIIGRAVGSMAAVVALAGGITYAALFSNTVTLSNNTISTNSTDRSGLKIYNFSDGQWETTSPGFHITGLVPGTGVDEHFYLQNTGSSPLNISARIPNLPGPPSGGNFGFSGFANLKIDITGEKCGQTVSTNMAALSQGQVALPCNPLSAGAAGNSNVSGTEGNYKIHFDINPNAVNGNTAGVGSFDIDFRGTTTNI